MQEEGDIALAYYSKKFDGIKPKRLRVNRERLDRAAGSLKIDEKQALLKAAANIEFFARKQLPSQWQKERNGTILGEKVIPIDSVGVYVPAGAFPLVSSVLMAVVPAKVAGVKRIAICTPPNASKTVLGAAALLGIKEVYLVGGAQAIAAMAFGTKSIPKVDKIVGPGNIFVSTAKRLLYGIVDIDMPAGPSEVLVFSEKGRSDWISVELKAQAEHDANAKALFVTTNSRLAKEVGKATKSEKNIQVLKVKTGETAIELINSIAPEHLVLFDGKEMLSKIRNAGSIFLGKYSTVAFGDYCAGTNHVLPTAGFAKTRGGLSTRDFVKVVAFQQISANGAKDLAKTGVRLAKIEGLEEHRKSMLLRRGKK